MSKLTDRLRQLANDAVAQYNSDHMGELAYPTWIADVRAACHTLEMAEKWDTTPGVGRSEALCDFRQQLKAIREGA